MSEFEKIQRAQYKRNRKKRIIVLTALLAVMVLICGCTSHIYNRMNQTYYIQYTENGKIDYAVQLLENDFYDQEQLGSDRAYITSLIDRIDATFQYALNIDTSSAFLDYQYTVDAQVIVTDKLSGEVIYDPVYSLMPVHALTGVQGNAVAISEQITIDYQKYDALAREFIQVYSLKDVTSVLSVKLSVNMTSHCSAFENSNESVYTIALEIPLAQSTVTAQTVSNLPDGQSKILACTGSGIQGIAKAGCILSLILSVILGGVLVAYIFLTRNDDINYTIKVKRLISSYRSFIQQLENDFNTEGYQTLQVKTFQEMLGIRDTLQAPILMRENADQTCTRFFIPTNTQLLYLFEIKVDNYDQLYANQQSQTV